MTWLLVRITPLGSMTKPEPLLPLGRLDCRVAGPLAAFVPPVAGVSAMNEEMLTTLGNRLRISSAWPGVIICICICGISTCCAPARSGATSRSMAARVKPESLADQKQGRIAASSVQVTAPDRRVCHTRCWAPHPGPPARGLSRLKGATSRDYEAAEHFEEALFGLTWRHRDNAPIPGRANGGR